MAIVSFRPGRTQITANHRMKISRIPEMLTEVPGGLYPMRLLTYEIDEYRVMAGWPVPVPGHDIRGVGLLSASGEYESNRPEPDAVITGADVRWVAHDTYYSDTDLCWFPVSDALMTWRTSVEYAPTLINDYEYRVGPERFSLSALNFDSDTANHMWLDGGETLPSSGYTVIMVMSPNSVYGNDNEVPYNGLWCPGGPTPVPDVDGTFTETVGANFSVTLQGYYTYLETDQSARARGVSVANALSGNSPLYLVMSFDRPMTSLYAASGPSSIRRKSLPTGEENSHLDPGVVLGRSTGDVNHTADMAMLDLGLYGRILSTQEIREEISILSQVYGDGS